MKCIGANLGEKSGTEKFYMGRGKRRLSNWEKKTKKEGSQLRRKGKVGGASRQDKRLTELVDKSSPRKRKRDQMDVNGKYASCKRRP